MTQILDVKPGEKVLEIGTGSGYQAAVLNHILPNPYQDHQDSIFSRKILNLETGIRLKITKPYQHIFVDDIDIGDVRSERALRVRRFMIRVVVCSGYEVKAQSFNTPTAKYVRYVRNERPLSYP